MNAAVDALAVPQKRRSILRSGTSPARHRDVAGVNKGTARCRADASLGFFAGSRAPGSSLLLYCLYSMVRFLAASPHAGMRTRAKRAKERGARLLLELGLESTGRPSRSKHS